MDEYIKKANELLSSLGILVIYTTSARTAATLFKNVDIISITSGRFFILNQNGTKIKRTFPFTELSEVSVQENSIKLVFGKITYSFESNDTKPIINSIKDVISHTLTTFEQRNIIFDDFKVIPLIPQNGFAADCRLYDGSTQYPNTGQYLNEIKKILIYMQPNVLLSEYKYPKEVIKPLLNVLPFSPNIQYLEIPKMEGIDTYELIHPFIKNNFSLKHLFIEGEKTKYFPEFISLLEHNTDSKLNGHSFKKTNMGRTELDLLYKYCVKKKIQSLGFHKAIKDESMDYFYNTFLMPELFDSLYILNLSNNTNIDVRKLLPKLRQVSYLSLNNCRLEICDVLSYASNMTQIKCIDLSQNNCNSTFNKTLFSTLRFSPSFDTLIIDDVSFKSNCIIPFFSFIFSRFEHGLRLSVASLITTDEIWTQLFDFLSTTTFRSLVSLVWDKNRLNPKLFAFLLKNSFFENLSLNSCFSSSSSDMIRQLGMFVQSSNALRSLSIRGNDENYLGSSLNSLLKMIFVSKSLKFLDISYSKCGDSGLKNILDFISLANLKIERLVFDDSMPSKSENMIALLQKAAKIKERTLISFPENDVSSLVQKKLIDKNQSGSLRKGLIISQDLLNNNKEDYNSNITNSSSIKTNSEVYETESFFLRPFNIYRYFDERKFPYFISQGTIHKIIDKKYLIDKLPNSPQKNESSLNSPASPNVSIAKNQSFDDEKRKLNQKDRTKQRKQLNPTINVFGKEDDPQDNIRRSNKKTRNQIDEISHQIFDFDINKEKKELNRTKNPKEISDDDDDIISKLNTKKRSAQSLRRQRTDPKLQPVADKNPTPRRTRTQSTRVKRKPPKTNPKNSEKNTETNKFDKSNDKDDIISKAKKRRGRSVDSINKEKKKDLNDINEDKKNINKPTKNKIINDYESEDYNLESNSSDVIINKKIKNDDDDLNVTAPILRNRGKGGSSKNNSIARSTKSSTTKKSQREKAKNKADIDSSVKPKKKEASEQKVNDGKITPRRPNSQLTNYEKSGTGKKKTTSNQPRPRSRNKNRKDKASENDYFSGDDGGVVIEPIKYKPVNWEFPELEVKHNVNVFWSNLKSQYEYDNLVEI